MEMAQQVLRTPYIQGHQTTIGRNRLANRAHFQAPILPPPVGLLASDASEAWCVRRPVLNSWSTPAAASAAGSYFEQSGLVQPQAAGTSTSRLPSPSVTCGGASGEYRRRGSLHSGQVCS